MVCACVCLGHTLKLLHFPELLQKSLVKVEDMKRRFDGILQTMTPTNDETREVRGLGMNCMNGLQSLCGRSLFVG